MNKGPTPTNLFAASGIALPQTAEDWQARSWEITDLFSPASPIDQASLIAGRSEQIDRLTEAVFERGRHAILFGERGVGKTSIANTFHKRFGSIRRVAAIRKAASPIDDFTSLWRRVFSEIEIEGQRVSERYPGEITPDDIVRELGSFGLNQLPIIILDEFDKLTNTKAKRLISHTLKAISDDSSSHATVILVGVAEDVTLLVEEHTSISRNITEVKMPRMSKGELNEIIDQRYPNVAMTIDDGARRNIVNLSRGLPEYVHFLARDAAKTAITERRHHVVKPDVLVAIANMVKASDQTVDDAYSRAILSNKKNNLYRQVLLACALAEPDDLGRFIPSDILPPLTTLLGRPIKIANFFPHIEAFCGQERGAILEKRGASKAYKYRFREPKMQPFVIMRSIADKMIPADVLSQWFA